MSTRVEEQEEVKPLALGQCHVCNTRKAEVDVEVINLTANDVMSLQTCVICATDISMRTWNSLRVDQDKLLYTTLGTVGGEDQPGN